MSSFKPSSTPVWCWPVILLFIVTSVYSPSPANDFVWDDHFFVEGNAAVQGRAPIDSLWLKPIKFERAVLPLWRPLPLTVYAALHFLFGTSPVMFHLANVLLHAAVVVLLFVWLVELRVPPAAAFVAAALYGVHPFLTSAVTYVAGMADPLAAFFSLIALIAWHRAFRSCEGEPQKSCWQKLLLAGSFSWLCALFCKEWALLLPLLAALSFAGEARSQKTRLFWKTGLWTCLFIAGIYICFRSEVFAKTETIATIQMGWRERIACGVMSFGFYQLGGLFPINLRMDRYYHLAKPEFWLWYAAGILFFTGWYYSAKRFGSLWIRSGAWRGLGWFLMFWLFHSNLLFVLNAHVAEHWMYFAYMGLAWAGADLWVACGSKLRPSTRRVVLVVLSLFGLFWAGRGFARQLDWQDDFTFFQRNIEAGADTSRSHLSLGSAYAKDGNFAKAADHFARVLEKDPNNFQASIALARCHFFMGHYSRAAAMVKQIRIRYPTDQVLQWFEQDCVKAMEKQREGKAR